MIIGLGIKLWDEENAHQSESEDEDDEEGNDDVKAADPEKGRETSVPSNAARYEFLALYA
jgi:hypothetical protein